MKMCSVRAKLHAKGQKGEQTDTEMAKLVVYFRSFANAPKTCEFPQSEKTVIL